MFTFRNKSLNPLQRRSIKMFAGCLLLVVVLTMVGWDVGFPDIPPLPRYLLAISPAIPIAGMMAVVGRYVARETDEFIKTLVTQSILWAVGCTLIAGTVMGTLAQFMPRMGHLLPIVSIDLFCVVFILALRAQLWRNA